MSCLLFSTLLTGGLSFAPAASAQETTVPQAPTQAQQPQVQQQPPDQQSAGSISGTVVDQRGTAIAGARVTLIRDGQSPAQDVVSDDAGQFFFVNIASGPFRLSITAPGFATQTVSATLHPREAYADPRIALALATVVTQVRVGPQVAEEQIKDQEKQRVLGVVPNFYVTYLPNAVPLSPKQKFELAWKTSVDPVTFVLTGAVAGVQQADNDFSGYGQGAQGYGKRYGASYGDAVISTFIGGAILPSLLKQDPRYFYKGSGSTRSRILYAVATSVICKGDNGHWQANYSGILGSLAAGGISNLYYPAQNRDGVGLTFENTLIGIGESAGANILQEFVVRKLTPKKSSNHSPAQP
jgi:Carboxypeptidase regulatory-like domain